MQVDRGSMHAPQQLVFELPRLDAFQREDFLVSPCNQAAVALIDRWPNWPAHAIAIVGPAGSGKSHLASVWRQRCNGRYAAMAELAQPSATSLADGACLAIEDVTADAGREAEKMLFHLLNQAREYKSHILLTMQQPPGELAIALPDLRSRLKALPVATIDPIDDALLSGLLVKLFADRQLAIAPGVIKYLTERMERSAAAARVVVESIDQLALASHRKVSKRLAADALAQV